MAPPRRPAGQDHHHRLALQLTGAVLGLAGVASVALWIGASEAVAGCGLALACASLFAAVVAQQLRIAGMRAASALAWMVALLAAAAAPVAIAVFPGRVVAEGTFSRTGDVVHLAPGLHGTVRVLVSGPLPEASRLGFSLRLGPGSLEGSLRRGATWWRAGDERRHYHEDRRSVLLSGDVSDGVDKVVLERVAGPGIPMTVHVYAFGPPPWLVIVLSLSTGLSFAFLHFRTRRTQFPAAVSLVAVCSGVLGSISARPDAAVGPVLAGLLAGTLVGVPLGRAIGWGAMVLGRSRPKKRFVRDRPA